MSEAMTPSDDIKRKIETISIEELIGRFPEQEKNILTDLGPVGRLLTVTEDILRELRDIRAFLEKQNNVGP